jgi:hypothetical protein
MTFELGRQETHTLDNVELIYVGPGNPRFTNDYTMVVGLTNSQAVSMLERGWKVGSKIKDEFFLGHLVEEDYVLYLGITVINKASGLDNLYRGKTFDNQRARVTLVEQPWRYRDDLNKSGSRLYLSRVEML